MHAPELGVADAAFPQQPHALGVRATAPHRADVARLRAQRDLEQRDIELDVVREDDDRRASRDRRRGEVLVGPRDDDVVGIGDAGARREDRPRVDDDGTVPEEFCCRRHRAREVDRAEDQHVGLRRP